MSSNERARHLEQFVAESEPPPQAQHLPPMPSASQRFAAMQEQQLAAQRRGEVINFIDPYSHGKAGSLREFNPFQSLVMRGQQQPDDDDESTDEDTSETTDDTISSTAESKPKKPIKVAVPKKVPAAKTTVVPQRPAAPPPPPPPAAAAPAPVPVAAPVVVSVAPVPATVATAPASADEEPRGIMDQSMAFLKKNFWAILTVIVILVAIGVAFIYFARPRASESTVPKVAPQVKTNGPPGTPARWSNVENEVIAPAEEITRLQKEKQAAEEANEELQKRVLVVEEDVKQASQDQKAHLRDIEKLQKMCEQLETEKEKLKEDNTQMAEFIMQNNLIAEPQKKEEEKATEEPPPPVKEEKKAEEQEGVAEQTNFDEKIDVEAIEKSAIEEEKQFQTVDQTQPPTEEKKEGEEEIEEEKLPWQK